MINKDILADLDDLDEPESPEHGLEQQQGEMQDEGEGEGVKLQDYGVTNIAAQKHSRLLTTQRQQFLRHISTVTHKIDNQIKRQLKEEDDRDGSITESINKSNHYTMEINKEIAAITKFIKSIYSRKIPELESIVTNPTLYCKALLEIEQPQLDAQDQNRRQPFAYLSPHQRISLRISISTPRDPLAREEQADVLNAAQVVLELNNHNDVLKMYLQASMQIVAPNLCQLVGSVISAKLIATAGGVEKLAAMPACNIQVMGGTRSAQVGFSQLERNHTGVFGEMEIVREAPKKFQIKLVRMLATNTAKCARADYLKMNNGQGARMREEMYTRFEKVQEEGGLMRVDKPLEIPDLQPKKKRGGKRHRKTKELYEMSELRKNQNRLKFGEAQQQIQEGVGLGMLSQGLGKLKVNIKKQKLKVSKKMQQRANKKSGLESSLNLNAHQGIQLINPALQAETRESKGTESYFAKEAGFRTVLNSKLGQ